MSQPLPFSPATATWFTDRFGTPTDVQSAGWAAIAGGDDALLIAPTGSGKTLAAFLVALDRIGRAAAGDVDEHGQGPGWQVVYISPLKALVYDIERNLHTPLREITATAAALNLPFAAPRVDVRTGDTTPAERRRQTVRPGEILVTTPESLYLLLTSGARAKLTTVRTVIIDEIHALAPGLRGTHLMLSVARLARLVTETDASARLQRIGLSATVAPIADVAGFLTGGALPTIVDTHAPPKLDLHICVPVVDMTRPWLPLVAGEEVAPLPRGPLGLETDPGALAVSPEERASVWPAIEPEIIRLILQHRSTIIFVNARGLAERLAQRLHEHLVALGHTPHETPVIRAHHGSIAHGQRREIEEALKRGELRGIVATSSLELGIDMGTIDLVIQVAAPDSVARGLQRVGRAGHQVGGTSIGRIFPKHQADLAISAVIADLMRRGAIEAIHIPRSPLDVLCQQVVAMVAMDPWHVPTLYQFVRTTFSYRDLAFDVFIAALDMLTGAFPAAETGGLSPRLNWDRFTDTLSARKGSRLLAVTNAGTIADRGNYGVFLAETEGGKPVRVGELDEEMVYEARVGETFILGASTWRITEIGRDRILVNPAPAEPGKLPFWKGDGPGRPIETGRALGAFYRHLASVDAQEADAWLEACYPIDTNARANLIQFVAAQKAATDVVPSDRHIVIELFRDQLGDHRMCILSPFGARIHRPWALAIEEVLGRRSGLSVQSLATDDGIALRFSDGIAPPAWEDLMIPPEEVEALIVERLGDSPLFAAMFREAAGRSLLLPRRNPGRRAPLWQQRLRAQTMLGHVRKHPRFPIVLETYRTCLQDVFDLPALVKLLSDIASGVVSVHVAHTRDASPFSRGISFTFVDTYMYEVDQPTAERRAQALTLDRELLRSLLGDAGERQLFDAGVLARHGCELDGTAPGYGPDSADRIHDLIRKRLGLTPAELTAAATNGGLDTSEEAEALEALTGSGRVIAVVVGRAPMWIAAEDAGLFRDAVGCMIPEGLPARFLAPSAEPVTTLIARWAAYRCPFEVSDAAGRFDLNPSLVATQLDALANAGRLAHGHFDPDAPGKTWCDNEQLARIRRRMLSHLRAAIAPVDANSYAYFLADWQGLNDKTHGVHRLRDAMRRLEGLALPVSEWEATTLPRRVPGYGPQHLDALLADGSLVWVGSGGAGQREGRVAFYFRETFDAMVTTTARAPEPVLSALSSEIMNFLKSRGAAFVQELMVRVVEPLRESLQSLEVSLMELSWAGIVTNDTALPLRGQPDRGSATSLHPQNPRRNAGASGVVLKRLGGRWSLVSDLVFAPRAPTEVLYARITTLLGRYGVLTRNMLETEQIPGGFTAIYDSLRLMEERGAVRRGHFVEGLGGAQFASAQAVERLRRARDARRTAAPKHDTLTSMYIQRVQVLSALDPANPWGSIFPFPAGGADTPRPKRLSGATLVTLDGAPVLWLSPKGERILTLWQSPPDAGEVLAVFQALQTVASQHREGLLVQSIDGDTPRVSPWQAVMREAGFRGHYKGLILYPPEPAVAIPAAPPRQTEPTSPESPGDDRASRRFAAKRAILRKRRR